MVEKNIKEVFIDDLLKEGVLLNAFDELIETGETRRLYGIKHVSSDHKEKILNITVSGIRRAEEEKEEDILLSDFQDKLDDSGKRYLTRIHANVRQMEILIDDLLEFSRIGRTDGAFEDVPSAEIIRDVLDVFESHLKKKGA